MDGLKRLMKRTANAATNDKLIHGYHYTTKVVHSLDSFTMAIPDGFWVFKVTEVDYYNRDELVAVAYDLSNEHQIFSFVFIIPKSIVIGYNNDEKKFVEYNPQSLREFSQQGPLKYIMRSLTRSGTEPYIDKMWIPL